MSAWLTEGCASRCRVGVRGSLPRAREASARTGKQRIADAKPDLREHPFEAIVSVRVVKAINVIRRQEESAPCYDIAAFPAQSFFGPLAVMGKDRAKGRRKADGNAVVRLLRSRERMEKMYFERGKSHAMGGRRRMWF